MATKVQKEWAENFFKENPHIKELYLNKQGEFFTDKNYVKNSLQKGKDGEWETYETIFNKQSADGEQQTADSEKIKKQE